MDLRVQKMIDDAKRYSEVVNGFLYQMMFVVLTSNNDGSHVCCRNCSPLQSIWPHPWLLEGFVLLDLFFSLQCFVDRCLSFFVWPLCCLSFFFWPLCCLFFFFWLLCCMSFFFGHCVVCPFSFRHCVVSPFSFDHCVVCPSSSYGFWLPLWYLQTFPVHDHMLL